MSIPTHDRQRPSLGRVVHYRSRTGNYSCAAIVTATQADLYRPNVEAGFIADLDSEYHVHLDVRSPGNPGKRADAKDFVGARKDEPISENVGGGYAEFNVPFDADGAPGTWCWPPRV